MLLNQEVRFLDKVTLLYRESYTAEKLAWEHLQHLAVAVLHEL